MKKLSDFQDENALDLLAEVFEPAVEIMTDDDFLKALDANRIEAVKIAIGSHKKAVLQILAAMDGVPVSEYHCNFFVLPARLIELITEIMREQELMAFFTPQGKKKSEDSFGSATASTGEKEQ